MSRLVEPEQVGRAQRVDTAGDSRFRPAGHGRECGIRRPAVDGESLEQGAVAVDQGGGVGIVVGRPQGGDPVGRE